MSGKNRNSELLTPTLDSFFKNVVPQNKELETTLWKRTLDVYNFTQI